MMNDDLITIFKACQRQERDAQQKLYLHYAPLFMGLCSRYCNSPEDAKDAMHDGFLKIFEQINKIRNFDSIVSWMNRIMVNEAYNTLRRHSTLDTISTIPPVVQEVDEAFDTDPYDFDLVLQAINELPEKYRVAFQMHDVDGFGYDEIADTLSTNQATARSLVARARQQLKDKLVKIELL